MAEVLGTYVETLVLVHPLLQIWSVTPSKQRTQYFYLILVLNGILISKPI